MPEKEKLVISVSSSGGGRTVSRKVKPAAGGAREDPRAGWRFKDPAGAVVGGFTAAQMVAWCANLQACAPGSDKFLPVRKALQKAGVLPAPEKEEGAATPPPANGKVGDRVPAVRPLPRPSTPGRRPSLPAAD